MHNPSNIRSKAAWLSLLLLAAILLTACQPAPAPVPTQLIEQPPTPTAPPPTPVAPVEQLYNTLWLLVGSGDAANPTVVPPGVSITAEFTPDGTLSGSSGCNNYTAAYSASPDGSMQVIPPIGSTRMACVSGMEEETAYLTALEAVQSFSFTLEGRLEVVYDIEPAYEEKLVYTPGGASLTNTQWVLMASGSPDAPAAVTPGVVITAIFADDGVLSGSSGCNTYATSYTAVDGQLRVNPPAATLMACPTGMEEEAAYLDTLSKSESYEILGQRLVIHADQGQSVLVYTSANLPLENTLWTLADFAGQPLAVGTSITAVFVPQQGETPATVGGSAGCNNYHAGYSVDGTTITIGPAATTMMFCEGAMDQETAYLAALQGAQTYQILGDTLSVTTATGTLTYTADRTPLTGALWALSGMGDPQNLQSPAEGAHFTAQFHRAPGAVSGVVTGSTGCNEYSAAYTASLTEIKVNLPDKTANPCSDAVLEQEQAYFLALNNARSYSIQGTTLRIPYDDGKQVLVYTATQVQDTPPKPLSELNGSFWYLHAMNDQPTLPGTTVTSGFTINADGASGSFSGSSGCNSYAATFGENLGVQGTLTSGTTCPQPAGVMQQESAYLQAIGQAYGYWLTADQLILNSGSGTLTYRRTLPVSSSDQLHLLQGKTWYLTSINHIGVVAGSGVANLFFDPSGALKGFTGCNALDGQYQTDLDALTITALNKGSSPCPTTASADQETAMMNGLLSARTYLVADNSMQITADTGVLNFSLQQPNVPSEPIPAIAVINGPTQGMVAQVLTFDGSASTSASTISSYSWDFDDGGKASGVTVQHAYSQAGKFNVTLTVENQTGFRNSAVLTVTIAAQPQPSQPPAAAISGPASALVGEVVDFSAADSRPGTNPIAGYAWNFGNGTTSGPSPDANASAIYDQPGVYNVTVTVMDTQGLSSSASLEIRIDGQPVASNWVLGDVLPGTSITLDLQQGQFSGFAGCNSYTGSYSASPTGGGNYNVSINGLTSTGAACEKDVMDQESAYLAALGTVNSAYIEGNVMVLYHSTGELVFYAAGGPQPR